MPIKNLNSITVGESNAIDVREIAWNPTDGTFNMGLLNDVVLQAGQELHFYGKATEAISNGDAVMFAGAEGDHVLMAKAAQAVINANPEYFIGVATQDFATNQYGYVTSFGNVRELDTTIYRDGDPSSEGKILYFDSAGSTPGSLTVVEPVAPNAKIRVAAVTRDNVNVGAILVRPMIQPKLNQLQDMSVGSQTDGDVLVWDNINKYWFNDSTLNVDYTNGRVGINDTSPSYNLDTNGTGRFTGLLSANNGLTLPSNQNINLSTSSLRHDSIDDGLFINSPNNLFLDAGFIKLTGGIDSYLSLNSNSVDINGYNSIKFLTQGISERMRITSAGNVGIGTTSPMSRTEIVNQNIGGETELLLLRNNSTSNGTTSVLRFINSTLNTSVINGGFIKSIRNTSTDNDLSFGTANVEKMRIKSNGNVGIGTTSPNALYKLHVVGKGAFTDGLVIPSQGPTLQFQAHNGEFYQFTETGTDKFYISYNGTSGSDIAFTIDDSKRIGIGTTSPAAKLDVFNVGGFTEGLTNTFGSAIIRGSNITPAINTKGILDIEQSGTAASLNTGATLTFSNNIWLYGRSYTRVCGSIKSALETSSNQVAQSSLIFSTANSSNVLGEKMRITSTGNVGIGTTSPSYKLHVAQDDYSFRLSNTVNTYGYNLGRNSGDGLLYFYGDQSGFTGYVFGGIDGTKMMINSSGNVGIGTTSPGELLEIYNSTVNTGRPTLRINGSANSNYNGSNGFIGAIDFYNNNVTNTGVSASIEVGRGQSAVGTGEMRFKTSNALNTPLDRMTITKDGNVGIGTTSPSFKLDVNGTLRVSSTTYLTTTNLGANTFTTGTLTFQGDIDDVRMVAKSSGYGGITWNTSSGDSMYLDGDFGYLGLGGITSPSYQLHLGVNSAAKPSSIYWTTTSDKRVKENIQDYNKGLNEILQIRPVTFDYNGKAGFEKTANNIGVIAQELMIPFPEAVNTYQAKLNEDDEEKTELYNVDFQSVTFALINSIKELQQQIIDLKTEIEILKTK